MPTYTLKNSDTEEIFEKTMKIAEYEEYMKENTNISRYYDTSPLVCDPTRLGGTSASKGDPTFQKYIIGRMKASLPGNTLNDRKFQIPREF
jgi:hypothetical protein